MILAPQKQCEANIRAWALHHGYILPPATRAEPDRCWYARTAGMDAFIRGLSSGAVIEPANFRNHGETAVSGFRETVGRGGAQIVVHREEIEIDFDHWNPWDVIGLIGHGWEVLTNRIRRKKTDPYRVARMLKERGINA